MFSLIAVSLSAKISENDLKCVLGYLKEGGSIDEHSFPAAPYSGSKSNCNEFINDQIQAILRDVKESLDEGLESTCILKDLENQFYADYLLKTLVYQNYPGLVRTERIDLIAENEKVHENMLENVSKRCGAEDLFNTQFQNNFKALSPKTMYCLRRFIVEKDLINTRRIKVNLNPQLINLAGFKCKGLLQAQFELVENEFKNLFPDDLSDDKVQCMMETFREQKYGNIIVTIKLLKGFKITDYQVKEYRKKFEDMMDDFSALVENC
ncbi:unnamed protein product [Diamesa hyperborea]